MSRLADLGTRILRSLGVYMGEADADPNELRALADEIDRRRAELIESERLPTLQNATACLSCEVIQRRGENNECAKCGDQGLWDLSAYLERGAPSRLGKAVRRKEAMVSAFKRRVR